MCEISSITKVKADILLGCTPYDKEFLNSTMVKIINVENQIFETSKFIIDRTRPCFNNEITPWVMIKESVPEKFLKRGNKVEFLS